MENDREYIYESKPIELAVNNIKANLFEIIAKEEGILRNLEMTISSEVNEEKINDLKVLAYDQNKRLNNTLSVCNDLFKEIEYLDAFTHDLKELKSENIKKYVEKINSKKITKAYEKDVKEGDQEVSKVQNEINKQLSDPMLSKVQEEMKSDVSTIVETPIVKSTSELKELVPDTIEVKPEEEMVQEVEEKVEEPIQEVVEEVKEPDVVDEKMELNIGEIPPVKVVEEEVKEEPSTSNVGVQEVMAPKINIPKIDLSIPNIEVVKPIESEVVEEGSENAPVQEIKEVELQPVPSTDIDISSLLQPIEEENAIEEPIKEEGNSGVNTVSDDVVGSIPQIPEVSDNSVVSAGDVMDSQLQQVEAVKDEIVNDPNKNIIQKTIDLYKYERVTNDVVRAILITKKQFEKSLLSRDTQEALLTFRHDLDGNQAATNTINAVDETINETEGGVESTMPVSSQEQLETMMEQANALYKEGKSDEAQAMYDKISSINKEINGDTKSNEYVKK